MSNDVTAKTEAATPESSPLPEPAPSPHASMSVASGAAAAPSREAGDVRNSKLGLLGISWVTTLLAACGGGGGGDPSAAPPQQGPVPGPTPTPPAPAPAPLPFSVFALDPADMAAARLVLQAAVAASDADIVEVKRVGAAAWLDAQMAIPVTQTAWDWLAERTYADFNEYDFGVAGYDSIQYALGYTATKHPDVLRTRVTLALSEFFVVGHTANVLGWIHMGLAHYWDTLAAHAFGSFRTLLEVLTLNPVMGVWLNTHGNWKEDPATGRLPDENYSREVMQLFTIGLVQLNQDGTVRTDANGQPLPTFVQKDVSELARVFTGYVWGESRVGRLTNGDPWPYPDYLRKQMAEFPGQHSALQAQFLGTTVPANTPAAEALRIALDALFQHPNVGPFFGRQMIQRLVTGDPSPAYVARVAAAFNDNGSGVRGDLKAVWKAVLLDEEARGDAGLTSPTHGKVREPMIRHYQWARTFGIHSGYGTWKWNYPHWDPRFNVTQAPFRSPSVFNFFRPGYVPPGTALAAGGKTAPEFQIVNETSVAQWVNMIQIWAHDGMGVGSPHLPGQPGFAASPFDGMDLQATYLHELPIAHDALGLLKRLNLLLAAGQVSEATLRRILAVLEEQPVSATSSVEAKRGRIGAAITFLMSCPEYLIQK